MDIQAITGSPPEPHSPPEVGRLTIVQSIYYSIPREDVKGPSPLRFSRWLDTDEQPYARTMKLTEVWIPLDLGWLREKACSYLYLENSSIRPPGKRPTQEEIEFWAKKRIEWGIAVGEGIERIGILLPEEGCGFHPSNPERLMVRCQNGDGKLSYYVVPE